MKRIKSMLARMEEHVLFLLTASVMLSLIIGSITKSPYSVIPMVLGFALAVFSMRETDADKVIKEASKGE